PFDHQRPVEDALFRGRHEILQRLRDNPTTNFALVGPSLMGKTSLIKRYLRSIPGNSSLRARHVYVDLFDRPVSEAALARAIRMAIEPGASSYYDAPEHLPEALAKARSRFGGPLEIILDETDRHVGLETMHMLIHLAVKKYCRLILVGRWRLM